MLWRIEHPRIHTLQVLLVPAFPAMATMLQGSDWAWFALAFGIAVGYSFAANSHFGSADTYRALNVPGPVVRRHIFYLSTFTAVVMLLTTVTLGFVRGTVPWIGILSAVLTWVACMTLPDDPWKKKEERTSTTRVGGFQYELMIIPIASRHLAMWAGAVIIRGVRTVLDYFVGDPTEDAYGEIIEHTFLVSLWLIMFFFISGTYANVRIGFHTWIAFGGSRVQWAHATRIITMLSVILGLLIAVAHVALYPGEFADKQAALAVLGPVCAVLPIGLEASLSAQWHRRAVNSWIVIGLTALALVAIFVSPLRHLAVLVAVCAFLYWMVTVKGQVKAHIPQRGSSRAREKGRSRNTV